jgi:hypothetical protein
MKLCFRRVLPMLYWNWQRFDWVSFYFKGNRGIPWQAVSHLTGVIEDSVHS